MIATLQGTIQEKLLDQVVLDVGGIGYGVYIPADNYNSLKQGETATLYIYEHIREQSHDLFGFLSRDIKNLFETLLGVNGVGPKMALNMLSVGSIDSLRASIAEGNVAYIQQASGVGKRLAERVIVDLKDKVGLVGIDLQSSGLLQGEASKNGDEAMEALMALGYTSLDAAKALHGIDPELATEDRVKQALKGAK
jgi:Holliday junction DNA helicase RuvA